MHIIFDIIGHIKVDYMLNILEIQPLWRDIGGHQHIFDLCAECFNRLWTLLLIFTAVNGNRFDTLQQQILVNRVDILFLFSEYKHGRRCALQTFQEIHNFCFLFHIFHFLRYIHRCGTSSSHIYRYWFYQSWSRKILQKLIIEKKKLKTDQVFHCYGQFRKEIFTWIFFGIVAEKSSVCRCPLKYEKIVRTSSSKPMSIILSASSMHK